jgi:predicted dehydrogenase
MTGRPLRVGVIGASYAAGSHLPVYARLPEIEVTAIATAHRDTAEAAARRFGIPAAYDDYRRLCQSDQVDLVDVVTRPSLHPPMAIAALQAGKHVLCEAPLAPDTAGGTEMADAAHAAGTHAVVDLQSRFSPGLWHLRRLVRDGWLGRVHNIHATAFYPTFTRPEQAAASLWCADATTGASSLRVHGLHTADLITWIFGPLTDVTGHTATRESTWRGPDGPISATSADSSALTARTTGGALCTIHTSWIAWHGSGWRLEVYGSDGHLRAEAPGHTGHHPITLPGARHDEPTLTRLIPPPDDDPINDPPPDAPGHAFAQLARRLARSVNGDLDPDLPTFDDALALLHIADAAETHG